VTQHRGLGLSSDSRQQKKVQIRLPRQLYKNIANDAKAFERTIQAQIRAVLQLYYVERLSRMERLTAALKVRKRK
jgi:hypothetical protein